ncbi:hypothetical protein [Natrinema halophilum]|uniref:Uncharacterized protein n=1 Tax=Natrinema halophilum TaxID=1699371 RepID=A0A7D5GMA4_9EURY|nr:hypothetical protein [Natrinema halophilum]QLG48353.1 hypothetical protein HYG82_05565 [Natrinema halophilum]
MANIVDGLIATIIEIDVFGSVSRSIRHFVVTEGVPSVDDDSHQSPIFHDW